MEQPTSKPTSSSARAEPTLERILKAYARHFDIERDYALGGIVAPAMAAFHSRGEKYVLTKRAKLWAVECHEYVFFHVFDSFTHRSMESVKRQLEAAEQQLVQPHTEHMYTYLSAVVLTRGWEEDALRELKRYKQRRNYRFSLHGWSQARLALLQMESHMLLCNRDGKDLKKTLRKITK